MGIPALLSLPLGGAVGDSRVAYIFMLFPFFSVKTNSLPLFLPLQCLSSMSDISLLKESGLVNIGVELYFCCIMYKQKATDNYACL